MFNKENRLVGIGYVLLLIYNVLIIPGLFEIYIVKPIYEFYEDNVGTLFLLEVVVIAGLFVNMILNFDNFKKQGGKVHLALTAVLMFCFFLKIVFFFMGSFEKI